MTDYTNDDLKGFLKSKFREIASASQEMADIRLAEMRSVVRLYGKWDNKRLSDLAFQVGTHEENARYCNAVSLAVEDDEIAKVIFDHLRTAECPTASALEAKRIEDEQRCSYSGKHVQYVDGKMVYRETGEVVPTEDRPR